MTRSAGGWSAERAENGENEVGLEAAAALARKRWDITTEKARRQVGNDLGAARWAARLQAVACWK